MKQLSALKSRLAKADIADEAGSATAEYAIATMATVGGLKHTYFS